MLITKSELAKRLSVCSRTVDRMLVKGMPHVKIGTAVRFDYDEVIAWLKKGE